MSRKVKKFESVDAYLAELPEEALGTLETSRNPIASAAPNATETSELRNIDLKRNPR
jgi:hypothetical protein